MTFPNHTFIVVTLARASRTEYFKQWRVKHKDRVNSYNRTYRMQHPEQTRLALQKSRELTRKSVLSAYGGKCACCGYSDLDMKVDGRAFLELDHINGGGSKEQKLTGIRGTTFYQQLKRLGFPSGFRVLCSACNHAIESGAGRCIIHG